MCKLFMIANSKKIQKHQLVKLLSISSEIMTEGDRDGFGWAARGKSGEIFGERYMGNKGIDFPLLVKSSMPSKFRKFFKGGVSESFGKPDNTLEGALLVHARASTNEVALKNSHPHWTEKFTLIHNGVVNYNGDKYDMKSTCDSEHLVHSLTAGGVDHLVEKCSGWYAVGALEHETGKFYLIKDSRASLHGTWVEEIRSLAYGTSAVQLSKILREMKWKHGKIFEADDNKAMVFNVDGTVESSRDITPKTWSSTYSGGYSRGYGACDYADGYYSSSREWKDRPLNGSTQSDEKKPVGLLAASAVGSAGSDTSEASSDKTCSTTCKSAESQSTHSTCGKTPEVVPASDAISQCDIDALFEKEKARQEAMPLFDAEESLINEMDKAYRIFNAKGEEISYRVFEGLMMAEQETCEIFSRTGGFRHDITSFM